MLKFNLLYIKLLNLMLFKILIGFFFFLQLISCSSDKSSKSLAPSKLASKTIDAKKTSAVVQKEVEKAEIKTVLKLNRKGGIYIIPCKVNGIDFDFFFDTGASDVTISLNAANKLYNLGQLSSSDIIGRELYQVADGSLSEGVIIVLEEIKIDKIILKNVKASIVLNGDAPLLLGQTALEKLGKFSFDYTNNELTIIGLKEFDFLKNNKLNQNLKKNYYVYKNSFLSDDAKIGKWIANERLEIYANPSDSIVIGALRKNQKIYALKSEYHYYQIPYARIEDVYSNDFEDCPNPPFKTGDLVYLLNAEGEGVWNVIHEDKLTHITCSYEPEKASLTKSMYDGCNNVSARIIDEAEEFIYWVQIRTLDGKKGWIKNPNCQNVIGTRPNCYNNASPAW